MDVAGITLTEENGQVLLHSQPTAGRTVVDSELLHALLEQHGFGGCLLHEAAIATAASDCNTHTTPFTAHLADRLDATVGVRIAADEMSAELTLTPAHGGKTACAEDVIHLLEAAGVVFGIDEAAVRQICAQGHASHVPVAHGAPPVNGNPTIFEALIPQTADRAPKVDADGFIDYRERGDICVVHAGAELMRRIPPTAGVDGHTVRGRVLPSHAGRDEPFAPQLSGAQVAPQDPNLLQAQVSGQPVLVPNGVMVEPILRVKEVNLNTGNIQFEGTVQIDGEVIQGMKVRASGDILVGGTVDGALLEAGGNIQIGGGIIAQADVRAAGSVNARFAEGASIRSGTVIALDDAALQCDLQALNQIIIGVKSPQRGRLAGGSATTMMLLRVPVLGSNQGGVTRVLVGTNPELETQRKALEERLEKEKTNEENLKKLVHHLTTAGDPKGMLERVKGAWQQAVQAWAQSLVEREELEKQLALTQGAEVEIGVGVAGAVDLAFGQKLAHLRTEFDAGVFSIDADAHILFTDVSGSAKPVA